MKLISHSLLMMVLVLPAPPSARAEDWTLQPRLSIGKLFPGSPIASPTFAPDGHDFRYEGTIVNIAVRAFPGSLDWVAVTLGGGITWFYGENRTEVYTVDPLADGIGVQTAPADFVVFPLSLGLHFVYPAKNQADFMIFGGIEGSLNFISGDVPMDQQVKGGYAAVAGFAVKVFEVGFRYQAFSDVKNLGAYLGFRLNPFELGGE